MLKRFNDVSEQVDKTLLQHILKCCTLLPYTTYPCRFTYLKREPYPPHSVISPNPFRQINSHSSLAVYLTAS